MDRGRNDYASYPKHTLRSSKASSGNGFGIPDRDVERDRERDRERYVSGDAMSSRRYLGSVYEPRKFDVEERLKEMVPSVRDGDGDADGSGGNFGDDSRGRSGRGNWSRRKMMGALHLVIGIVVTS